MQTREGVWYPMGGTRSIPAALASLAESLGVQIRTNVLVRESSSASGAVSGLLLGDGSSSMLMR